MPNAIFIDGPLCGKLKEIPCRLREIRVRPPDEIPDGCMIVTDHRPALRPNDLVYLLTNESTDGCVLMFSTDYDKEKPHAR